MGQKVNPHGLRVGIIKDWDSRWYTEDDYENLGSSASGSIIGVLKPWKIPKRTIWSRCMNLWQSFRIVLYSMTN